MIVKEKVAESTHWYSRDGKSAYQVEGKNGQMRATTLRDARQLSLVPSVTTILGVADKPALNLWKQQQVLLAALTLPKEPNESEADWLVRVLKDSKETGRKAADRGTEIHGLIQAYFENEYIPEGIQYAKPVEEALNKHFGERFWISEKSFAHPLGYGGKCDLYSANNVHDFKQGIVVDIKTKEGDLEKADVYAEHGMQLAAYREGFGMPNARCANIFVSSTQIGVVKIIEHTAEDLDRYWKMFQHLLSYWQLKNNHK